MSIPFFYITQYDSSKKEIVLDEATSRHIVQVLRMKTGEKLNLTDGKGNLLTGEIINDHKKHCDVRVTDSRLLTPDSRLITIAISLLKNPSRFEWFLEKATEIGVREIIPLICERTEKERFRYDRMHGICISAMLQSQQVWLPELHEPILFHEAVLQTDTDQKFIAYCGELADKKNLSTLSQHPVHRTLRADKPLYSSTILIGPEGDFTKKETGLAIQHHFQPVTLGDTRLRTETAAIVALTLLRMG